MNINKNAKGMSLVELLVAVFILILGMIGTTLLASRAWKTKGYILEATSATASASRTLTEITHELRNVRQGEDGSYPIAEVGSYSLTVFRDDDNDGKVERVHYYLDGEILKKGVTKFASGNYPSGDQTVSVIMKYVTNISLSQPLFLYYNNDYPAITDTYMSAPLPYDVRLVRVHLWVNIKPIVAPENVNLEGFAEMRNLNEF